MRRKRNKSASQHLPVLMVRGFGEVAPLPHIMHWYREKGFTVEVMPFSLANSTDMILHAKDVADHARALADRHGTKINLVGFSLGGIACLFALKKLSLDLHVARFVAYGSPFRGTNLATLARLIPPTAALARQVTPGSQLLAELCAPPAPPGVECVSIGGSHDLLIPAKETVLPWAGNVRLRRSHSDFLHSYTVHRTIASYLE